MASQEQIYGLEEQIDQKRENGLGVMEPNGLWSIGSLVGQLEAIGTGTVSVQKFSTKMAMKVGMILIVIKKGIPSVAWQLLQS